jgi:hypothetical protein
MTTPLSHEVDAMLAVLSTWLRVESNGSVYRVAPSNLPPDVKPGDMVWLNYSGMQMRGKVIQTLDNPLP